MLIISVATSVSIVYYEKVSLNFAGMNYQWLGQVRIFNKKRDITLIMCFAGKEHKYIDINRDEETLFS
jgi:hypothetical protein